MIKINKDKLFTSQNILHSTHYQIVFVIMLWAKLSEILIVIRLFLL